MISIKEKTTKKLPGRSSLFIESEYDARILKVIKESGSAVFHKKEKLWEVPVTSLSNILDGLCEIDDISLEVLKDKREKADQVFSLSRYKTKPFPYQIDGIQYGLNHNKFLLLDVPGLGKTLQAIYIAQELKKLERIKHCLIICGVNTLKSNWKAEIEKHSNLSCRILGEY